MKCLLIHSLRYIGRCRLPRSINGPKHVVLSVVKFTRTSFCCVWWSILYQYSSSFTQRYGKPKNYYKKLGNKPLWPVFMKFGVWVLHKSCRASMSLIKLVQWLSCITEDRQWISTRNVISWRTWVEVGTEDHVTPSSKCECHWKRSIQCLTLRAKFAIFFHIFFRIEKNTVEG